MRDFNSAYEALIQFLYLAPIGLVQTTLDGEITMINPMAAQLLMPLSTNGNLANLFDVLAPLAPQLRSLVAAPVEPGGVICEALRMCVPGSTGSNAGARGALPRTLSMRLLKLDAHSLMASLSDVTLAMQEEQLRLATRLRDASRIDSLTLMPNRTVVLERIEAALQRARVEPQYEFAVLFINADRFSRINLMLGQARGDELLRLMASRLGETVREHDAVSRTVAPQQTAARLGGDEFVVLLDRLRSADDVPGVAQRLCDTLGRPYSVDGVPVHASASIGVVLRANAGEDADTVLQDASLAMREAKRAGGARFGVFEPLMKESARRRSGLEAELRRALLDGELFVVYQPIVDLSNGSAAAHGTSAAAGFEALVRWRHPQRGLVSPVEFIGIAEETGLIVPLGEYVLKEACRQFVCWQKLLGARAPRVLSVNLSRVQLAEPDITARVAEALLSSGLNAASLQLEVTESMAAQDQTIQARLQELKAMGICVALDDFGTGYSSLASLHQLPIDVVKIDRSFVSQAESSAHHRVLIEATVRVARSLGMQTVAEGVETEGQAAILTALQCDKGQGYLYARPMTAEDATHWLVAQAQPAAAPHHALKPAGLSRASDALV